MQQLTVLIQEQQELSHLQGEHTQHHRQGQEPQVSRFGLICTQSARLILMFTFTYIRVMFLMMSKQEYIHGTMLLRIGTIMVILTYALL